MARVERGTELSAQNQNSDFIFSILLFNHSHLNVPFFMCVWLFYQQIFATLKSPAIETERANENGGNRNSFFAPTNKPCLQEAASLNTFADGNKRLFSVYLWHSMKRGKNLL